MSLCPDTLGRVVLYISCVVHETGLECRYILVLTGIVEDAPVSVETIERSVSRSVSLWGELVVVDPVECISGFPEEVVQNLSCQVSLCAERLSAVAVESFRRLAFFIELVESLFSFWFSLSNTNSPGPSPGALSKNPSNAYV